MSKLNDSMPEDNWESLLENAEFYSKRKVDLKSFFVSDNLEDKIWDGSLNAPIDYCAGDEDYENDLIKYYENLILNTEGSLNKGDYFDKYFIEKGKHVETKEKLTERNRELKNVSSERRELKRTVGSLNAIITRLQDEIAGFIRPTDEAYSESRKIRQNSINFSFPMIPPQAVDVERSVVGMLINDSSLKHELSSRYLNTMFYKDNHRKIHGAILDLGERADKVTIVEELKRKHLLEHAGGPTYIRALSEEASKISNPAAKIDDYVKILENKACLRKLIVAASEVVRTAYEDEPDSVSGFIRKSSAEIIDVLPYRHRTRFDINEELEQLGDDFNETIARKGVPRISSGLKAVDEFSYGIMGNRLIVVGARPKIGKTTLAVNILDNVISQGYHALMYSFELTRQEILQMMVVKRAGVMDREKFMRCDELSGLERKAFDGAVNEIKSLPFKMYDYNADIDFIVETAQREKAYNPKLKLVVVDPLQAFEGFQQYKSKTDIYSNVIKRLKEDVAKRLNLTVVLTAQLKQDVERRKDKKPKNLDDFADCKGMGEFCDLGVMLYRPEFYWPENEKYKNWASLIFVGSRFGKSTHQRKIGCDYRYSQMFDVKKSDELLS